MKKSTAKSGVPMRVERRNLNDIAAHVSGAIQVVPVEKKTA